MSTIIALLVIIAGTLLFGPHVVIAVIAIGAGVLFVLRWPSVAMGAFLAAVMCWKLVTGQ